MIKKSRLIIALTAFLCAPLHASAQSDDSAEFFSHVYWSLCKSNAGNPDALRANLKAKGLPELPPEKAKLFTEDAGGDAWPIPHNGAIGDFVLALPTGKKMCAVYARRADVHTLEVLFSQFGETAPAPSVSDRQQDVSADTGPNGKTHTISYIWSTPGRPEKLLFTLTTSESPSAQVQALGTVSVIRN
ncbi:hypothetical protein BH160DRAFT_6648 [Burkholderia sp. H160]|nr:hypothetical protein BH160DRAFT_6648 [Burkholderia sp. H160]